MTSIAHCRWHGDNGLAMAERIAGFLAGIGIDIVVESLAEPSLLPSMTVRKGAIVVDPAVMAWPGDLLHEAGHIAVSPPEQRATRPSVSDDPAEEMAAIAWSVAAARACDVPLDVLFMEAGYRGGAQAMCDAFAGDAAPFGVPLLAFWQMTTHPTRAGAGDTVFPAMRRWLR